METKRVEIATLVRAVTPLVTSSRAHVSKATVCRVRKRWLTATTSRTNPLRQTGNKFDQSSQDGL
ncbi:Hypothetical protein FKW44_008261 [Caligus rogercresseyi]|uniref:Uncharacterized protein n=1 Tax=Caligus rogercresseyi TaxID=217165 RepID=A0A7T8QU45_CALRO|nr:Hypothetical protein FKW44_008261 [Caligus rogercresseyi]